MESVRYRENEGCQTALIVKRGHKLLHIITMPLDSRGVRVRRIPKEEERHMRPLEFAGRPYPVEKHIRRLLKAGESLGIVDGTRKLLEAAL